MVKNIAKHKYIYIFITTLSLIGFISGYIFYSIQSTSIKENTLSQINIKEELSSNINNTSKRIKKSITIFIYSIFIITQIYNIFDLFYSPFQSGFIINLLKTYSFKFSIIYSSIYLIIPILFQIILIRISINISINIIKLFILKERKIKQKTITLIKKYFLITIMNIFYEILITIFSTNINAYLMTILSI